MDKENTIDTSEKSGNTDRMVEALNVVGERISNLSDQVEKLIEGVNAIAIAVTVDVQARQDDRDAMVQAEIDERDQWKKDLERNRSFLYGNKDRNQGNKDNE